jgi:hypothetical protein
MKLALALTAAMTVSILSASITPALSVPQKVKPWCAKSICGKGPVTSGKSRF